MKRLLLSAAFLLLASPAVADISSVITFPAGSNEDVQFNKNRRFAADTGQFTYSTTTHKLSVPWVAASTLTLNGVTYYFPTTQSGGYFLQTDGAGGLSWQTPSTFITSTGVALGVFDGNTQISSPTSGLNFSGDQFVVSLQGSTTAFIALNPSSVTVMGPLSASSPITLTGSTFAIDKSSATLRGPDPTLGGDLSGTISAAVVADNSHTHDFSTLENIDISLDTNLAATAPIILTGDTLSLSNTFTSSLTVTGAGGINVSYGMSAATFTASSFQAQSTSVTVKGVDGFRSEYGVVTTTINATAFNATGTSVTFTGSGGIFIVDGASITNTSSSLPILFNSPNYGHIRVNGTDSGGAGLRYADLAFGRLVFHNPVIGSGSGNWVIGRPSPLTDIGLDSNGSTCSDLSGICQDGVVYIRDRSNFAVDTSSRVTIRNSKQSNSALSVGGPTIIGTGYSDEGPMPTDGGYVRGQFWVGLSTPTLSTNTQVSVIGETSNTYILTVTTSAKIGSPGLYVSTMGAVGIPGAANDDAYGSGWNGSTLVPTKNAVYDKIETVLVAGGTSVYPATATASFPYGFTASTAVITGISGSTVTYTSATFTNLNVTNFHGGYIMLQSSQSLVAKSSATTVTSTFVPTGISVTITPRSASSLIKISASGSFQIGTQNNDSYVTLFRDGLNLASDTGICVGLSVAGGLQRKACSMILNDSPATTSAVTYSIRIKSQGASTMTWGQGDGSTPNTTILIVEEWLN